MFPTHLSGGESSGLGVEVPGSTHAEAEADEEPIGGSESSAGGVGERSEITVVMVSAAPP